MIGHLAHVFQRRNTILVIQAGAVLLLISSVLTWVSVGGSQSVSLSGAEMTTLVRTIGVIGVIGGVLITIARRWVRGAIAAVLLGGGLIALAAAVLAMLDPAQAAAPALSRLGADGDVHALGVGLWAGLAGSAVLISGALAVLLFSPGWDDESEGGP